jgi:hypothetical protein
MVGTISPRYMNYISKEEMVKAYRNQSAKSKGDFYWNFKIIVKTSKKVCFFNSKSHSIQLLSQNDSKTESHFGMTESCLPNKDFTFTYTTENF